MSSGYIALLVSSSSETRAKSAQPPATSHVITIAWRWKIFLQDESENSIGCNTKLIMFTFNPLSPRFFFPFLNFMLFIFVCRLLFLFNFCSVLIFCFIFVFLFIGQDNRQGGCYYYDNDKYCSCTCY